ncbi:MAG: DNA mismatch repair endonuclease MutL [Ktedonobacterales bacterium]|nr:DNA mismatch repair endonuclease MutL [Ktedonobacterales bacterium]
MSSIQILAPDVAAKIAAGEVVERPASIVKELVENAIDAGATRITVDLQGGGTTTLRVTDNGRGVARDELPLVFARHGTSKLRGMDDFEVLHTLGFRGEALASVGAVAAVTFAARPAEAEAGARLEMLHGQLGEVVAHAMPPGTIVTVRDLFAHVPARLKFLKSRQGEAGYCMQILERYALAYPEIAFTVQNEGRLALRTPGDGTLTSAIAAVYDLIVAEGMVDVAYGDPATVAALPLLERPPVVRGMTSRPAVYKSNKQHMHLFVNRRWVRSQSLSYAIEEAYHSLLLTGRHPISVIDITLDPALLDVNVHPAKTEVKFARERQVYAAVQRAVRAAIIDTTAAPVVSAGAFTVIAPAATPWPTPAAPDHESAPLPAATESGDAVVRVPSADAPPATAGGLAMAAVDDAPPPTAPRRAEQPLWNPHELRGAERPLEVHHTAATPPPRNRLPVMRVLGQMSQSYIITEGPDGMYMIDQHAAHERILLEKMVAQWRAQALPAQALLEPVVVELPPDVYEAVEERLADLQQLGFDLEPFGAASLMVRAVPAPLASHASADGLADLLPDLVGGDHVGHAETWEEHALANIACRAAIKAGKSLAPDEQRELVRQLEAAGARHSCCHGRPTTIHISLDALEREFARR